MISRIFLNSNRTKLFGSYSMIQNRFVSLDAEREAKDIIDYVLDKDHIVLFSVSDCEYCKYVKGYLNYIQAQPVVYELDELLKGDIMKKGLYLRANTSTTPVLFTEGNYMGSGSVLMKLINSEKLKNSLMVYKDGNL